MSAIITGPVNYYNFNNNVVTIGGRRLGIFAADGGIQYTPKSDNIQSDVGADGVVHYSGLNDARLEVTITLMEDSDSVAYLMALIEAQNIAANQGGQRSLPPLPFKHRDLSLGDSIISPYCIFMNMPEVNKQRTIGTRVFRAELPYAKGKLSLAQNVGSFLR